MSLPFWKKVVNHNTSRISKYCTYHRRWSNRPKNLESGTGFGKERRGHWSPTRHQGCPPRGLRTESGKKSLRVSSKFPVAAVWIRPFWWTCQQTLSHHIPSGQNFPLGCDAAALQYLFHPPARDAACADRQCWFPRQNQQSSYLSPWHTVLFIVNTCFKLKSKVWSTDILGSLLYCHYSV